MDDVDPEVFTNLIGIGKKLCMEKSQKTPHGVSILCIWVNDCFTGETHMFSIW